VPTIILFQRAENARFLRKNSHLPKQRCTDRKQGLRGTVTYLNFLNKSIDYQACAWVLPHAARSELEVRDSPEFSSNCVSAETDLGNIFLPAVLPQFHFRPTEQFIAHIARKGWRYDAQISQAMRKLILLLYIDLDPAIIICGAFYHCHLLEKKLGERARFGPLKQNYRRHDTPSYQHLAQSCRLVPNMITSYQVVPPS
jgi:hypothetical protein